MKRLEVGDWVYHPDKGVGQILSFSQMRTYVVVGYPYKEQVRIKTRIKTVRKVWKQAHPTASVRFVRSDNADLSSAS